MRYILAMAVHPWGYHIAIAKHGSTSSQPEGCSLIEVGRTLVESAVIMCLPDFSVHELSICLDISN